jgi:FkbM family methyltransferase
MRNIGGILVRFASDIRALGLRVAIQGIRSKYGHGTLVAKIPAIGSVLIRRSDSDYETLRQVFVLREYAIGNNELESYISSRYSKLLADGKTPVIIDLGANIGLASLWFKERYPKATILAVEPNAANFQILKQNLARDHSAILLEAAVGSSPGNVELSTTGLSWAVQTKRTDKDRGVMVVTVEQAISKISGAVPLIVKVDIEGFEKDLFARNIDWLDDACAVFIEPHDWMLPKENTSNTFQRAFGERDFNLYIRGENLLYVRR